MKKETQSVQDNVNILDVLLDEDNEDPIILYGQDGKNYNFDQVAVIPMDDKLYAILKPLDKWPGVADDEAIVFRINENPTGETTLDVETDEPTAVRVFDEYYRLADENK